jgi:Bacterial regulatory helix-turn-helix protein, lysR family
MELRHLPLSQQIRQLERELGVTLLTRSTRSVELTPPGRVFIDRTVKILAAVDDASSRLAGSLRGWKVACLDIAGVCYRPLSPESASIELVAACPSSSSSPLIANVLEVLREIT